jgi:hypothetical protein
MKSRRDDRNFLDCFTMSEDDALDHQNMTCAESIGL